MNIETESKFDKLDVIFEYGNLPSKTKEENIGVLWYNEKDESYEIQESILDKANHTISFSTTHFSTYLLVDKEKWEKSFQIPINYGNIKEAKDAVNIAYVVDYSQSMSNEKLPKLRESLKQIIERMQPEEKGCVIGYKLETANILAALTENKEELKKGVENLKIDTKSTTLRSDVTNLGIEKGIAQLSKDSSQNGRIVMVIGDTDVAYNAGLIEKAKSKKIRIFVLNVNPKTKLNNLKQMTKETNGFYYELNDLKDAYNVLYEMKYITLCGIDTVDKDEDGLLDVYETKGMLLCNGKVIHSDPNNADTDSDSVSDLEEMGNIFWYKIQKTPIRSKNTSTEEKYYKLKTYLYKADSDMDGISDYSRGKKNDKRPKSNKQEGVLENYKKTKIQYSYPIKFELNYKWFIEDSKIYNKKLQNASSIFATLAYYNSKDNEAEQYKMVYEKEESSQNIMKIMVRYGLTNVEEHYLGDKFTDNHIVQFNLGQKKLYYEGKKATEQEYYVVPIFIRGTKGQKEWYSNFDIGNTNDVNEYIDWTSAKNHKGFDMAANRVVEETKEYMKKNN